MDTGILTQERRYVTEEERVERAYQRAKVCPHKAWYVSPGHYEVISTSDPSKRYDIRVTGSGLRCTCKAASYGKPCDHAAKVALRLQRERRSI